MERRTAVIIRQTGIVVIESYFETLKNKTYLMLQIHATTFIQFWLITGRKHKGLEGVAHNITVTFS